MKIKRTDWILFLIAILVFGSLSVIRSFGNKEGGSVLIRCGNEVVGTYSLATPLELDLAGADGGYNHLSIRNGRASVTAADCPDQSCVHQLPVSSSGETIVCLPHRISIEIIASDEIASEGIDSDGNGVDAVAR